MSFLEKFFRKITFSDHRKAERLDAPSLVAYYWDGATPTAREIQNISSEGFYLLTEDRLRPGTVITMTLQRSSSSTEKETAAKPHLTVMSMVIRQGEDGIGFTFLPQEHRDSSRTQDLSGRPAGSKAIKKFLEEIKSDDGQMGIEPAPDTLKPILPGRNGALEDRSVIPKKLVEETGQALVITALGMSCLLGFIALAADVGIMMREKRLLQIAADSAAIAGAADYGYGNATSSARAAAAQNGFTDGSGGATVAVNPPPVFGPFAHQAGAVEVIISQNQPTLFMGLFGRTAMTITARAVATTQPGTNCMYTLGASATGILLSGTGSLDVPSCGIIVDSNSSTNAIINSGTGNINAKSIGIVGSPGFSNSGTGRILPTPTSGIVPNSDPLGFLTPPAVPTSGCTPFTNNGTGASNLQPGCYSSLTITGTGPVTLAPGVYVLNGPVTLNGTGSITGSGVTLYITSAAGTVTITGTQSVNLSAPTSGPDNGILFFEQRGDNNPFTVTGTGNMNLTGIFYLPSAPLILTGTGNANLDAAFVVNQLESTGTGTVTLSNYAVTNPSTPLTSIKLVE